MREHMPDVDLLPVVMDGGDEPKLIASNIKDGEPAHLIRGWECDPQTGKGPIGGLSDDRKPVLQRSPRIRMNLCEFDQSPPRDDVHAVRVSQYEIAVKQSEELACGCGRRDRQ
jgi:hypothetical protein